MPPSLTGEPFFSTSPKVCSLEEDLHGMNLSLQVEDFDGGDDKLDIALGDDDTLARKEAGPEAGNVSNRREDWFIPDGRFKPLFLLGGEESIFLAFFAQRLNF